MSLLGRLFGKHAHKQTPVAEVRQLIDRFTTATHAGVDAEDIGRYPHKQRMVMAFHFGAIEYLAQQHQLDETETLGVFVMFLDKYFNLPVTETGSISELLGGFESSADMQKYREAGLDVFRRWHEQNERRAPLQLGEMLQNV
ncbi:MAG: hypothetical protein JSU75_05935 [Gammaproteobacteria bacterium]|nr:MAG: hypothetical protein JSU75_05935 [Gammaproteobacteria bacterium]